MLSIVHAIVLAVLAALLLQVILNLRAIPCLAQMPRPAPRATAVLIPARNEAGRIATCIAAWARQDYPDYEVIVLDDDSTDGTADAARAAARGYAHVRILRGTGIAPGWRGKPWACHRVRSYTRAAILVFADADIRPEPETLTRLVGALDALAADIVSAMPAHASPRLLVRAVVALQNWAALTFVPAWMPVLRRSATFSAANGQLLAIRASVYDAVGGYAAVRGTLAEDTALGRRAARLGHEVRLVDGGRVVRSHPYPDFAALWRANVRNLHAVLFGSVTLAIFAAVGAVVVFLAPPLLFAVGVIAGKTASATFTWFPLIELALGFLTRAVADRRAGYAGWLFLLHPAAVAVLVGMILESTRRAALGSPVEWRGRRYTVKDEAA